MNELRTALFLALSGVTALTVLGCAPYRDELQTVPRRLLGLVLWLAVLTLIVFLPVIKAGEGTDLDPETLWFPGLFAGHLIIVLFLLAWWRLRGDISLRRLLHLSFSDVFEKLRNGAVIGVITWGLTIAVTGLVAGSFSDSAANAADPEIPAMMRWLATQPLCNRLIIIAAAMTIEEAFFRGFLQPRIGLLASSLFFALSHFNYGLPFLVVGVFVVSLVLGSTFARWRDLLPCIVAHGVFDAIQLLVVLPWAVHVWGSHAG